MDENGIIIKKDISARTKCTGRLKQKILELLKEKPYRLSVELVDNADVILESMNHVVTQDAIILNKCESWLNLTAEIIKEKLPQVSFVDLGLEENIS